MNIGIHDIGPVRDFEYKMRSPGVHVLRGRHGAGKTTILRTVELATSGKTDTRPTKADGAKRGEATVAGKTLRIATRIVEDGELSIDGIGELSIADLHTPRFDKPETRDRHRIKALARLAGIEARASLFHPLVNGAERFDKLIDADALKTDDLVEMAARIKRALEKHALAAEESERTSLAYARAKMDAYEAMPTQMIGADVAKLEELHRAAVEDDTKLNERARLAKETAKQIEDAKARLADMRRPNVDERTTQLAEAVAVEERLQAQVERARIELERMTQELRDARTAVVSAREAVVRENELAKSWDTLLDVVRGGGTPAPTDGELKASTLRRTLAAETVYAAKKAQEAVSLKAQADQYAEAAAKAKSYARKLRDAARDTQDVLSEAIAQIPGCPLHVVNDNDGNARLCVSTERDPHEPFDELSDGERWPIIMSIAASGGSKLIVLPQAAWGELSTASRNTIDELAKERGCYVLTAEVDDHVLRAAPWNNDKGPEEPSELAGELIDGA